MQNNGVTKLVLPANPLQVLRLRSRAREPIKYKSIVTVGLGNAVLDHTQHNFIGNQLAAFHQRFCLLPKRRAETNVVTKHVTCRQMRQPITLRNPLCLGALACSRRTQQNHRATQPGGHVSSGIPISRNGGHAAFPS